MSQIVASADFDTKVLGADKAVLVDFFATWCGPCKRLAPVIDELSSELAGKVDVYKLDIDQSPDIAARFKVSSVPTIMLFAVWKNFGYNMVIFLAGLQAIPHAVRRRSDEGQDRGRGAQAAADADAASITELDAAALRARGCLHGGG